MCQFFTTKKICRVFDRWVWATRSTWHATLVIFVLPVLSAAETSLWLHSWAAPDLLYQARRVSVPTIANSPLEKRCTHAPFSNWVNIHENLQNKLERWKWVKEVKNEIHSNTIKNVDHKFAMIRFKTNSPWNRDRKLSHGNTWRTM
jgi:hypothetical protein